MDKRTEYCNIPNSIIDKFGRNLHNQKNHPIEIIKNKIFSYFKKLNDYNFYIFDNLSPFVDTHNNFDKLLIPNNHPARSKSDTYYINKDTVLRTHTTAHQNDILAKGIHNFLIVGDVYRKDEVDKYHYPIFHQMEGVLKVNDGNPSLILQEILVGLVKYLFPDCINRVNDDYFPFTEPSYEIEVYKNDTWIEVLGCGVIHHKILENNNLEGKYIAFGLGLERLAMIMFNIPDIRYFWSNDPKFLNQFSSGEIVQFIPYSNLNSQSKDIAFWIDDDKIENDSWLNENDFFELVRNICKEWVESIVLFDSFTHPKTNKRSHAYRITYSPYEPTLKNHSEFTKICNNLQDSLRCEVDKMNVILR